MSEVICLDGELFCGIMEFVQVWRKQMKAKEKFGIAQALAMISQIGITMVVCIGFGVWFGGWLDGKLGTGPICLIACVIIGILAGFMNVYKLLMKGSKNK